MDLETLFKRCEEDDPPPVCVLTGTERFLLDRAVKCIRATVLREGIPGFNDEVFYGRGLTAGELRASARTLPMMASRRFLLVRNADHMAAEELASLTEYVRDPVATASMVILGEKLDGRSKLIKAAKTAGVLVEARELRGAAVRNFIQSEAKQRNHPIEGNATAALVDALGSDLHAIDDAIERLGLFVGDAAPIRLEDVEKCITRIRIETVWALVDAVGGRDEKRALATAESLLHDREPPLKILALMARQLRIVAKVREALAEGLKPPEAAKRAGAPPFKARELAQAARAFTFEDFHTAFGILAEADLELKGARRPDDIILQEAVVRICRQGARSRFSAVVRQRRKLVHSTA